MSVQTTLKRVHVKEDTYIERPDLGEAVRTLVRAGDAIPVGLEDFPRHAVSKRKPKARRKREKR